MNAALLMVCLAGSTALGQPNDTVFKAPGIEVKTGQSDGKDYSYLLYNRVYLGRQYHKSQKGPNLHRLPTTYFHDKSPIGLLLKDEKAFPPKDAPPVMVLGMDVGTLAAYAHPGQTFHFTERVPTFVKLSLPDKGKERYFTFVQDALDRGAKVKIFEGEPRTMLEKHGPDKFYKLIVIETYKLPVIEVHKELLTKEAIQMMMGKLRDDGILAFHTSNRYYQLTPIIASAANELKLAHVVGKDSGYYGEMKNDFRYASEWVMVARNEKVLEDLRKHQFKELTWQAAQVFTTRRDVGLEKIDKEFLWTDKGEQSFRGLYYSDPEIDKLHDTLRDLEDFFMNRVGISHTQMRRISEPIGGVIRAWSGISAEAMNRPLPKGMKKDDKK